MGRGRGGYTESQQCYTDSGGHKVTDTGAIFVGEQYIGKGYEVVFRQEHPQDGNSLDLTIKDSKDENFVKNIEVKQVTSPKPSQTATNIKKADKQIEKGDTIALYFPNRISNAEGVNFVKRGIDEARRKGYGLKGPIEVWFRDKECVVFPLEGE